MERATARLRKTFQYTDDNDSEGSLPEALDEEEQANLIRTLAHQNAARNKQYTYLFLVFPILSSLLYLPHLSPSSQASPQARTSASLLSILSITSLLSSAYILSYLPQGKTGIGRIDALNARREKIHGRGEIRQLPRLGDCVDKGPLELYLPYLNLVLVGLLAVAGLVAGVGKGSADADAEGGAEQRAWFSVLPAVVYGVVLVAKALMGSVDVRELEGLRYGYKGA